jgi:hypothetical protein
MSDDDRIWWLLRAGPDGALADDVLAAEAVTVGGGDRLGDFREDADAFLADDSAVGRAAATFLGLVDDGMAAGDVAVVHDGDRVVGVGEVGEPTYEPDPGFTHVSDGVADDHHYRRPVEFYDWGTPVRVEDLPERFRAGGEAPVVGEEPLTWFGSRADRGGLLEAFETAVREADRSRPRGRFGPETAEEMVAWLYYNAASLGYDDPRRDVDTGAGVADLVATADDGDAVLVVEKDEADDSDVGRLLATLDAHRESAGDAEALLVAEAFTDGARRAARAAGVELRTFSVSVSLDEP